MTVKKITFSSTLINLILSVYIVTFLNAPFWNRFSSQLGTTNVS